MQCTAVVPDQGMSHGQSLFLVREITQSWRHSVPPSPEGRQSREPGICLSIDSTRFFDISELPLHPVWTDVITALTFTVIFGLPISVIDLEISRRVLHLKMWMSTLHEALWVVTATFVLPPNTQWSW